MQRRCVRSDELELHPMRLRALVRCLKNDSSSSSVGRGGLKRYLPKLTQKEIVRSLFCTGMTGQRTFPGSSGSSRGVYHLKAKSPEVAIGT